MHDFLAARVMLPLKEPKSLVLSNGFLVEF